MNEAFYSTVFSSEQHHQKTDVQTSLQAIQTTVRDLAIDAEPDYDFGHNPCGRLRKSES